MNSVGDYSNFSVQIPRGLDGAPHRRVRVSAIGAIECTHGHMGLTPKTALDYQTYRALGWTILATGPGTRFTIDSTGQGMSVTIESRPGF